MTRITNRNIVFLTLFLFFTLAVLPASAAGEKIRPAPFKQRVEVVFVLDTTGSMADLIDGAKKKIWSIANTIVDQNPDAELYFGLVAYRDIGDEYVTKKFPLTTDLQSIYASLLALRADGGGDTPESVNEALDVAVNQLGWTANKGQERTSRILFLVGDAPPHMDYKQDRKYPVVIREAVAKGIIVNTVQAGDMASTKKIWKEMAQLGHGEYYAIPQDGGQVIIIVTPYDERIRVLQIELSKTVIPYGSKIAQEKVSDKTRMYETADAPAAAEMSSYVNKSGRGSKVITGSGDLVDAVNAGKVKLKELPKEDLPSAMQKMSTAEQEKYVAGQNAEREKLSKELSGLVLKRDKYIQEQSAKEPAKADSFDRAVKDTLKKQVNTK